MITEANRFYRLALHYGGQVGFIKLDSADIPRIKKSAFAATNLPSKSQGLRS